jgi:hypothetical protein
VTGLRRFARMVIETTHRRYGLYAGGELIAAPADNNRLRYLVHGVGSSAGEFAIVKAY